MSEIRDGFVSAVAHLPVEVGGRDADGFRTFGPIGQVCATCSDFPAGRLVPVSFCTESMRLLDAEDAWLRGDGPCPPHLAELERAAARLGDTHTGAGA